MMVGVSRARPAEDDSHPGSGGAWVSYSIDSTSIHRHVRLRSGAIATSSVERGAASGNLRQDFDLSWMRLVTRPAIRSSTRTLRVADLFAGCGGMSLGLAEGARAIGMSCDFVFACEMDPIKAAVYNANLRPQRMSAEVIERLVDGDVGSPPTITERALIRDLGSLDILLGGPPCQGHSDLNNHTRRDDDRNALISRMVRFAELLRPEHVIIENVEGVRHDRRRAAARAAEDLSAMGYQVQEMLVSCLRLGVPQARRRYMLVASTSALSSVLDEFVALNLAPRSVGWALDDLLHVDSTAIYDSSARHSAENQRRIDFLFEHDLHILPDAERPDCHRLKKHSYNGVYGRMDWGEPAPTITTGFGSTGQGRFVHPLRPRTITPHEAARLQTYPDFFDFCDSGRTQLQKMIGNSVPPLAMTALATVLLR